MADKPQVRVLSLSPLKVGIAKNGRGVSLTSALSALQKAYPEVDQARWDIQRSDHGCFATLKPEDPAK